MRPMRPMTESDVPSVLSTLFQEHVFQLVCEFASPHSILALVCTCKTSAEYDALNFVRIEHALRARSFRPRVAYTLWIRLIRNQTTRRLEWMWQQTVEEDSVRKQISDVVTFDAVHMGAVLWAHDFRKNVMHIHTALQSSIQTIKDAAIPWSQRVLLHGQLHSRTIEHYNRVRWVHQFAITKDVNCILMLTDDPVNLPIPTHLYQGNCSIRRIPSCFFDEHKNVYCSLKIVFQCRHEAEENLSCFWKELIRRVAYDVPISLCCIFKSLSCTDRRTTGRALQNLQNAPNRLD